MRWSCFIIRNSPSSCFWKEAVFLERKLSGNRRHYPMPGSTTSLWGTVISGLEAVLQAASDTPAQWFLQLAWVLLGSPRCLEMLPHWLFSAPLHPGSLKWVLLAVPASLYALLIYAYMHCSYMHYLSCLFSPGGLTLPLHSIDECWWGCCGQPLQ